MKGFRGVCLSYPVKKETAAKSAWLSAGGSVAEFEAQWPEMREMLRTEVIEVEIATRRERAAMQVRGVF